METGEIKSKVLAPGIRPEDELLLLCARASVDSKIVEQIRTTLRKDIDWEYLIRKALGHGVLPLLHRNLNNIFPEAVPKPILSKLQDHFRTIAHSNFFLTIELIKILNLFEKHGISAIPYKGPVLAMSLYDDLSFRQFSDLDIIVRKGDALKAKNLLISRGYQELSQLPAAKDYRLLHDSNKFLVELHWSFARKHLTFPLDPESLRKRLEQVSLVGTKVLSFSPEDMLLILCANGCKDRWLRLSLICDVAQLIRQHQRMNWEKVIEQATVIGSKRILFLGLFLASDLLRVELPEFVLRRVEADGKIESLAAQVLKWLFSDDYGLLWGVEKYLFHLKMRERFQDRVLYFPHLLGVMMNTSKEDRSLYPLLQFSPLYNLFRPFRLIGRYGLRLLKHYFKKIHKK